MIIIFVTLETHDSKHSHFFIASINLLLRGPCHRKFEVTNICLVIFKAFLANSKQKQRLFKLKWPKRFCFFERKGLVSQKMIQDGSSTWKKKFVVEEVFLRHQH